MVLGGSPTPGGMYAAPTAEIYASDQQAKNLEVEVKLLNQLTRQYADEAACRGRVRGVADETMDRGAWSCVGRAYREAEEGSRFLPDLLQAMQPVLL